MARSRRKSSRVSSTSKSLDHLMEVDETPSPASSQDAGSNTADTSAGDQVVPSDISNVSETSQQQQDQTTTSKKKTTNKTKTPASKSKRGGRQRRGRKSVDSTNTSVNSDNNGDKSLFDLLYSDVLVTEIVDNWIKDYKSNREKGLLLLVQFIIDATSSKEQMTLEMLLTKSVNELIDHLDKNISTSPNYPLSDLKDIEFRKNLSRFIKNLVHKCQNDILFDEYLLDNIILFLVHLSRSKVQSYRHTATFLCMKLATGLVDVSLNLTQILVKTNRQFDSEKKKPKCNRAIDKVDLLERQRINIQENLDDINDKKNYIVDEVLGIRSRDVIQNIRLICVSAVGSWIKKKPEEYIKVDYLKYLGWSLFDDEKDGVIRKKTLEILQNIYQINENLEAMFLFTKKYKNRIIAMTLDVDTSVAVIAINVITLIDNCYPDLLTDEDRETMYKLIFVKDRSIAQAGGEFLNQAIITDIKNIPDNEKQRYKNKKLNNILYLKSLVMFFIESEFLQHGNYLVDSMINATSTLKDWQCMTYMLLDETDDEKLDDVHATALVKILTMCIKQLSTGEIPEARVTTKKHLNAKDKEQIKNDKILITEHFAVALPNLLTKYQVDESKLPYLLLIPQYFDLGIYVTLRLDKHLSSLLQIIDTIVKKTYDEFTLETAAKTLEIMCHENSPIAIKCDPARIDLIDSITCSYTDAIEKLINKVDNEDEANEEELYKVEESMMKISKFYGCHNMNRYGLLDSFYKNIKNYFYVVPDTVIKYSIDGCYFSLLWDLYCIKFDTSLNPEDNSTLMQTLQLELNAFMTILKDILNDEVNYHESIRDAAFSAMCDLIINFDSNETSINESLQNLPYYEVDEITEDLLSKFIENYVFCDIEMINNKKRNFLCNYCKLIIRQKITLKSTIIMFKNYKKYYNDYGDILKDVLGVFRDFDRIDFAKHMQISLISLYKELEIDDNFDKRYNEMKKIKELASRLLLLIGLDVKKNREPMMTVHKDGINFALEGMNDQQVDGSNEPPPNISYLEILAVFTNKLMKRDKDNILKFLEEKLPESKSSDDGWESVMMYRNGLRSRKSLSQNNHQPNSQIEEQEQCEPEQEQAIE
ncbi:hypothetical protein HCN44_001612 [Aphidius gifuensis]|uniref:SCD domain-containing protein n=2 Tax=Aphidius gifuensis TaxID=684658 RepID=A0A834XVC1_APHGI|nr:hypothetical protein HCN44_001612 [Aphidius gifuensis]